MTTVLVTVTSVVGSGSVVKPVLVTEVVVSVTRSVRMMSVDGRGGRVVVVVISTMVDFVTGTTEDEDEEDGLSTVVVIPTTFDVDVDTGTTTEEEEEEEEREEEEEVELTTTDVSTTVDVDVDVALPLVGEEEEEEEEEEEVEATETDTSVAVDVLTPTSPDCREHTPQAPPGRSAQLPAMGTQVSFGEEHSKP